MQLGSQSEKTLLHIREQPLSCWSSQSAVTPLTKLVYCVTVAFKMTERADHRTCIKGLAHFTALLRAFFFFFWQTSHHPGLSSSLQPRFGSLRLLDFPKAKIAVESEEICGSNGHSVHQLRQRRLTADWLDPRESGYLRICSKVSSDWLPSYIKAMPPVLEIFKMDDYFPNSPHTVLEILQSL